MDRCFRLINYKPTTTTHTKFKCEIFNIWYRLKRRTFTEKQPGIVGDQYNHTKKLTIETLNLSLVFILSFAIFILRHALPLVISKPQCSILSILEDNGLYEYNTLNITLKLTLKKISKYTTYSDVKRPIFFFFQPGVYNLT